jgi:hypothetical protein
VLRAVDVPDDGVAGRQALVLFGARDHLELRF